MATLQGIEARIRLLEDLEAIRQLKYRYCYAYDEGDFDRFMSCFADDCVVELGLDRRAEGKAQIEAMFRRTRSIMQFSAHMVHNPVIEVQSDTASGIWYLHLPSTRDGVAMWSQARYDEQYVRDAGVWKISSEKVTMHFATPYDQGWAKERIMVGLAARYAALLGDPGTQAPR